MDLDIEMGDALEVSQEHAAPELPHEDILQPDEPDEPGEVVEDEAPADPASTIIVPTKLHIRGLDTLHTDDIKAYAKKYDCSIDRVEWIDDTSANLIFSSEASARYAITALADVEIADPTALPPGEVLPAKPLEGRPEISLKVRFAVESDKKQAGAALRSRYYLLHPEHDPEERRRKHRDSRSRYRDRGEGGNNWPRRRLDSEDEVEVFEASMYDDVPSASRRGERSLSHERSRSFAHENRGKELFGSRGAGRDRSASPMREVDSDGSASQEGRLASSRKNRLFARSLRSRISSGSGNKNNNSNGGGSHDNDNNKSKELFPTKSSTGRRGGQQLDELEEAIGSARLREEDRPKIAAVTSSTTSVGGNGVAAFNIRGSASQLGQGQGFSIKGLANAKELFPDKLGDSNVGKELFDGIRSRRRQRAEDLFS